MTLSPASIIEKSAIASPTWRRRRFLSLLVSNAGRCASRAVGAARACGPEITESTSLSAGSGSRSRLARCERERDACDAAHDDLEADQVADQEQRAQRPADGDQDGEADGKD